MTTITKKNSNLTVSQINIAAQKATVQAEYKALIGGIQSELNEPSYVIHRVTYSEADLVARFQARLDAAEKTKVDRTALHASVAAERAAESEVAPVRAGFKQYLQSRYGKDAPELQKFGFTPVKAPQRTVASKAAGIVQNKATRVARNTMGKKARLAVKGAPAASGPTTALTRTPATPNQRGAGT